MSQDGVRQINENVIKNGRSLIITDITVDKDNLPEGAIFVNPTNGDIKYLKRDQFFKDWAKFKFENIFEKNSFDDSYFIDNSFHGSKITDDSITTKKYMNKSITSEKIADNTIKSENIESISGNKIKNGSITTEKIHEGSITVELLSKDSINEMAIINGSINHNHLQDNCIDHNNISSRAVHNDSIDLKCIDNTLLADKCVKSLNIDLKQILNEHLSDECISSDKIKPGAIKGQLIPQFGIKDDHIESIDGSKIIDKSISGKKIKLASLTGDLFENGSIGMLKLTDELQKVLNNSITVSENIKIGDNEYFNTAFINGNVIVSSNDDSKVNMNVNGDITATGDITASRVFNPYFADITEGYIPDEELKPGDAVSLSTKGNLFVEKTNKINYNRFIGFVSDNYADVYGASKEEILSGTKIPIALIGRIKITLPLTLTAKIGDYLYLYNGSFVSSQSIVTSSNYILVARFLENKSYGDSNCLCQVFPPLK